MDDVAADHRQEKARSRLRAERTHQGRGHWHVNVRSKVIVCRDCGARIPRYLNPQSCPDCGGGEEHLSPHDAEGS
jgi:rubrerythrin